MFPRITIDKVRKKCRLIVDYRKRKQDYYLTEEGIMQAGEDLYDAGKGQWLYSSTVDFPQEYGVELDVRAILEKGWHRRKNEDEAPRRSVIEKMFAVCSSREFQKTLTPEEKTAFKKLKKEVKNARCA